MLSVAAGTATELGLDGEKVSGLPSLFRRDVNASVDGAFEEKGQRLLRRGASAGESLDAAVPVNDVHFGMPGSCFLSIPC